MNLSWINVDPDLHTCNPESAKEIAVNVIAFPPHEGIESKTNQSFCDAFGTWACVWNFSRGEDNGEGIVNA